MFVRVRSFSTIQNNPYSPSMLHRRYYYCRYYRGRASVPPITSTYKCVHSIMTAVSATSTYRGYFVPGRHQYSYYHYSSSSLQNHTWYQYQVVPGILVLAGTKCGYLVLSRLPSEGINYQASFLKGSKLPRLVCFSLEALWVRC